MSNSQFSQDEIILLDDAFDVLSAYFHDRESFLIQYKQISDAASKIRFLRLASIYRVLVKAGNFEPPADAIEGSINYYDITYKFIALISIIEAMFSVDEWRDFYQWLRKSSNAHVFPIEDQSDLDRLHAQYKSEYGAIRNAKKFFEALDIEEQKFLKSKLVRLRVDKNKNKAVEIEFEISHLAELLYGIRSEFMHKAKLIVEFDEIPALTVNRRGKPFISNLSLNSLMHVFELGLVKHFGLSPERRTLLI